MTETLQDETREAPTLPLHMRRDGFDPVPDMAAMRDDEGVREVDTAFGMPAFLVARHADVKAVLADSARFSNESRRAFDAPGAPEFSDEEREQMRAGNLLGVDPPEHTRLRRMLTPEFTVRRMRRLEPRIMEIVDDHLDAMEQAGAPADLVADFALPIPSLVICELLGVPYADRAEFQERTSKLLDISLPMDERMDLGRESRAYMADLVARAQAEPGEDMLGHARARARRWERRRPDHRRADRHRRRCCSSPGTRPPRTCSGSAPWPCCGTRTSSRSCATTRRRSRPPSRSCCASCGSCTPGIPRTTTRTSRSGASRSPRATRW